MDLPQQANATDSLKVGDRFTIDLPLPYRNFTYEVVSAEEGRFKLKIVSKSN